MTFSEFQTEFESARKFVRLHGWVVQSEEKLSPLREALSSAINEKERYFGLITESLRQASTTTEKLFSISLLRDSSMAADELAGLLFEHLQGEFGPADDQFFMRQFFRQGSPIPRDVSAQITDRVYMTYQRAILQAMKIDRFESSYQPNQIVLFMTQLLCRIDLNEQNRAILYLLLSRIDAPLPPSLGLAVAHAMKNLEEIIRDVELRKDKVLSEGNSLLAPETRNDPWASRQDPAPAGPPTPQVSSIPTAPSGPSLELSRPPQPRAAVVEPTKGPVIKQKNPAGFSWGELQFGFRQPGRKGAVGEVSPGQASLTQGTNDGEGPSVSKGQNDQKGAGTMPTTRQEQDLPVARSSAVEPTPVGVLSGTSVQPIKPNFVIRFDQEREGLSSLLGLVTHGPPPENAEPVSLPRMQKHQVSWRRFWWILLLVGVFAVAFWLWTSRAAPVLAPKVSVVPISVPSASPAALGVTNDLDIRSENGGRYWYPRAGQSLWRLYRQLQFDAAGPIGSWPDFQKTILALNPSVTEANLIFPSRPLQFDH